MAVRAPIEARRLQLQAMRRRATGLLIAMTLVFLAAVRLGGGDDNVWTWVQAGAEAAMVGGLADWFAVTALFRHPLGLPIPHTAVLVERKDAFGVTLGEFVQENFLVPDVVAERVTAARPAERLAAWLSEPANAEVVAGRVAEVAVALADVLDDEDAQALMGEAFDRAVKAMPLASLAGKALRVLTRAQQNVAVIEAVLSGFERMLDENRAYLRSRFEANAPWWLPGRADRRVFDRMFDGALQMVAEIRDDPDHEIRHRINAYINGLAHDLERSPELAARAEQLKGELLGHPELRRWLEPLWRNIKETLRAQAADPNSELRRRLAGAVAEAGQRLRDDPQLAARIDHLAVRAARVLTERFSGEISGLVGATVARWDATETAGKLELLLGRDLQFIRINGTVVGGLAGLLIHAAGEVLS